MTEYVEAVEDHGVLKKCKIYEVVERYHTDACDYIDVMHGTCKISYYAYRFKEVNEMNPLVQALKGSKSELLNDTTFENLEVQEPAEAPVPNSNQILLSSLTNGRLPDSGRDYLIDTFPEGTWSEDISKDIPAVDPDFYWDANVLEGIVLCLAVGEKGLLVGDPGCGKTSSLREFAAVTRQPFARFNGKGGIDPSSFLGKVWVTVSEGSTVPKMEYKEGLMPIAVREGYLTVIDEIFKLSPDIQMALQSLYEKDGFLMLDDKPGTIEDKHIRPHSLFRLFGTDNSSGTGDNLDLWAASQQQDVSTLDRFGITLKVSYLPQSQEVAMLTNKFKEVDTEIIESIVKYARLVRTAFRQGHLPVTLSPRGLMAMCSLSSRGVSLEAATRLVFRNKLGEDDQIAKADELMRTVIF